MKTKIWVLAFAVSALAMQARAQDAEMGSTSFGIRAGVNFQNLNGKDFDGDDLDYKLKTGFHIGVNAEIPVAPQFYVQPGVLFSTKGAKVDDDEDTKINLSYIEVPINFLFKPELGTGHLLLGVGPYVAFGIGGKIKSDAGDADVEFEKEISGADYLSGKYFAKRFDAGGNLLAGYEFSNKFSIQLNAQLGMVNINPEIKEVPNDKSKTKNTGFGISVGYRF